MTIERSIVAVVRCENYDLKQVCNAVNTALELAEIVPTLENAQNVLLKPNLLSPRPPEDAVTTHPSVVEAVGRIALRTGCKLWIGDSPPFAGENPSKYRALLEKTGIWDVAARLSADVVRFEEQVKYITNPSGRLYRRFEVADAVSKADLIINISKLKNHALTRISGAVKNLFGCVPGVRKGLFHIRAAEDRTTFAQMLVDLAGTISNAVHLMDGIVAMEGEGPSAGQPRHLGLILASKDPVALDAVASAILNMDPMSIDTTRLAHEQGLGCGNLQHIDVRGVSIDEVRVSDWLQSSGTNDWKRIPTPLRRLLRRQLLAVPVFRKQLCTGCGDCVRVCPSKALSPGRPPRIDLGKCIRCYCCQEICNSRAVELKYPLLAQLLRIDKTAG